MAEIAAGAVVAEQVVATTLEGGALVGYAVAKPTLPLKASFTQIATAPKDDSTFALARSHHTLNVIGNKAYIFGGRVAEGKLASNDIHTVALPSKEQEIDSEYSCLPAIPSEGGKDVPCARSKHAACTSGHQLAIFGGCDEDDKPVDSDSCIWIWDRETSMWSKITTDSPEDEVPQPRFDHKLFNYGGHLILYGGRSSPSTPLTDTWFFDLAARVWRQLPDSPTHSDSVALVEGTLYAMSKERTQGHCHVHVLDFGDHVPSPTKPEGLEWLQIPLPQEKAIETPEVRAGAGLIPITTGYGRQYLAYIFGYDDSERDVSKEAASHNYYADFWTYQVASKNVQPTGWTDFQPAAIKDSIRNAFGKDTGGQQWGEVEVQATEQVAHEGKVHPGPRAYFGCGVAEDGRSLVLWGGVNPKGEKEADGWLIKLE